MQSLLKFGVKFKHNASSTYLSTLITVESTASFADIIQLTLNHFRPFSSTDTVNYCFLLHDEHGRARLYIDTDNIAAVNKNVVHLVTVPSIAAQQLIECIRSELHLLSWDSRQCCALISGLRELISLLPCPKFATEFIKQGGHEVLFCLTEHFDYLDLGLTPYDTNAPTDVPDAAVWSHLVAALSELAEYSINSTEVHWDEEEDDNTMVFSHSTCPDLLGVSNGGESFQSLSLETVSELFSWQLLSEKFITVLVHQCRFDVGLETLCDGLRVVLNILINCPTAADYVIAQTGPDFIFRLLRVVHEHYSITALDSLSGMSSNHSLVGRECATRALSGTSSPGARTPLVSSEISSQTRLNDCYSWLDSLGSELLCISLDIIYACVYRTRHNGTWNDVLPAYLSAPNLFTLAEICTQLQNPTLWERTDKRSASFSHTCARSDKIKRVSDYELHSPTGSGNSPREWMSMGRHGSFCSGQSTFFCSDSIERCASAVATGKSPSKLSSQSAVRLTRTQEDILEALYRLQRLQFAYLADQMTSPLDPESFTWIERLQKLCNLALEGSDAVRDASQVPSESDFIRLGFKFPKQPCTDFSAPPGHLGFHWLYVFLQSCTSLKQKMLNYTRNDPEMTRISTELHDSTSPKLLRASKSSVTAGDPSNRSTHDTLCDLTQKSRRRTTGLVTISALSELKNAGPPSFPLVITANALTRLLCEIFGIHGSSYLDAPSTRRPSHLPRHKTQFYPMLFRSRGCDRMPLEDVFVCTFSVFFYCWVQLNAGPDDLNMVLSVVHEQVVQALSKNPISVDQFEHYLATCTPQTVRATWKERDLQSQDKMLQTHAALKELHMDLMKLHESSVREQRLSMLTYGAPLDYVPIKGPRQQGRDNQKLEVVLSPDRKSLILRDPKQCTREIWLLVCIDRVATGLEERIKKNPERTLIIYMRVRDSAEPIQVHLIARSVRDYKYWLDGFHLLLCRGQKTDQFNVDVQRLVELDMKVRLNGLDLYRIPSKPKPIPPDPPEFDFDEEDPF